MGPFKKYEHPPPPPPVFLGSQHSPMDILPKDSNNILASLQLSK